MNNKKAREMKTFIITGGKGSTITFTHIKGQRIKAVHSKKPSDLDALEVRCVSVLKVCSGTITNQFHIDAFNAFVNEILNRVLVVMSIDEFYDEDGISKPFYVKLRKEGRIGRMWESGDNVNYYEYK